MSRACAFAKPERPTETVTPVVFLTCRRQLVPAASPAGGSPVLTDRGAGPHCECNMVA
jgi:hypothetical protein